MAFHTLEEYAKIREERQKKEPQGSGSNFHTLEEYQQIRERRSADSTPALTRETAWENSGMDLLQRDMLSFQSEVTDKGRRQADAYYQGIAQQLYDGTQKAWDYIRQNASSFSDEELEDMRSTLQGYRQELQAQSAELSKSEMIQLAYTKSDLQKRVEAQQKVAEDDQWWNERENALLREELQDYVQRAYDVGMRMASNGLLEQGNWMNIWGSLYDFGAGAAQSVSGLASMYKSYYGEKGTPREREEAGKEAFTFVSNARRRAQETEQEGITPTQWFEQAKKGHEKAQEARDDYRGESWAWIEGLETEYAYASYYALNVTQREASQQKDFVKLSTPNVEELQAFALPSGAHTMELDDELKDLYAAVNREAILQERNAAQWTPWHRNTEQAENARSKNDGMAYGITFERAAQMSQEERNTFNYLVNTGATTEAKQYMQALMPYLQSRAIQANKEEWDDMSGVERFFMSLITGLDNSLHFVTNWTTDEGYNADYNAGAQLNLAEAGTVERAFRGAASSLGSMLPSMAIGAVTGGMGSALTTLATAGGSARQQGLQQGMNGTQATVYGLLCGASEGGLQWLMSGIPGLKGALPEKLGETLAQNYSSVLARSAIKWAGNVGSELLEENVQNYLEPLFVSIVTNKEYEAPGWEEFLDTSLSVLILSGTLGGVEAVRNLPAEYAGVQAQWVEQALRFPEDSEIYKAGMEVTQSILKGETFTRQQWKDMLQRLGADQKTMNQIRKGKLSTQQAEKIFGKRAMVAEELEKIQQEETDQVAEPDGDPDWAAYEAEHPDRYTRDTSFDLHDNTRQFEDERDNAYYKALERSDEEIAKELAKWQAIRDDVNKDEIARDQAQHRMDAYELIQAQRAQKNAAQVQQGGMEYAEGIDDGSQRDAGMGTRGQAGAVEEGAGGQIARGTTGTEAAVLRNLRETGRAESARKIGVERGSEEVSLYVLQQSDIDQSSQWKRIQESAREDGARVVFFAGDLKVYNPVKKEYSKVEGIYQVAADGAVTYYIKADKKSRNAERIYLHEKFHDIVENSPELLPDLVKALDERYGRQEIAALINSYVEAYDGIYGRFEEGMTEEQQRVLEMEYMNEVFADAYADIKRGRKSIEKAREIMRDQTDAVQRAAQNRKGTENKNAPPKQRFYTPKDIAKSNDLQYNKSKRSREAQSAIDRLNAGEEVSLQELMAIPEVAEAERNGSPDEVPTIDRAERESIRETAIEKAMRFGSWNGREYAGEVRREKRADIVIGLPGSGKSSVYTEPISLEHGSRVIDTDEYRQFIPEYNGSNAALVHEEASLIKGHVYDSAVQNGENIILSIVGHNSEKLRKQIEDLNGMGYRVYLHLNELPNGKAIARAIARYVREDGKLGRYVPIGLIASYGDKPTKTYLELTGQEDVIDERTTENAKPTSHGSNRESGRKGDGMARQTQGGETKEGTGLAGWDRYSNDVPYGEKPRLIDSSANTRRAGQRFSFSDDVQGDFIEQAIDKEKRVLEERRAQAGELSEEEQQRERERQAAAEKKRLNAQRVKSSALKNQIKRTQEELAIQRATLRQLKNDGLLTKETKKAIEARIEDIKETLRIQQEVLAEKLKEERAAESERKKKKRAEQERLEKGRISKRETTNKLLKLFSAPLGTKTDMKVFVEDFLDRLMRSGSLTDADRKELFMGLFYNGEEVIEKDDYFRGIREEVKEGRIYVPESVREGFAHDWEFFRKKAWGCRIYLTNLESDMGIDTWTDILNENFGGFDASADLKLQLERIVEMAEEGRDEHISLAEMMQRNQNNFGWSVEEQMADLEDKMEHMLIGFAEKVELEIRLTERRAAEIAEDRERQKEAMRRKREEREGNEERAKLMGMIQKLARYQKKASPEFKKMIGEALKGIDIVARRISPRGLEDLQVLKRRYFEAKEKNGKNFLRDEKIEERIARLDEMTVDDMSFGDVVELSRVICNLVNAVENSKRMFTLDRQKTVDQLGKSARDILKRVKGCGEGVLRKWFHSHLDGKRFFAMLGDWDDNSVWAKMGEALSEGELRMMNYQMRATRIFDEFTGKKENREWLKEAAGENAKWLKYKTWQFTTDENGNEIMAEGEIEITPMMRVALLMHSKNDQNLRHIAYGGIHIPNKELYIKGKLGDAYARGTSAVLSPSEVRKIVAECSEQEREFAKLLEHYYNHMSKECINEVSMQVDGFERACVTNYYPIKCQQTLFDHVNEYLSYDFQVENTPSIVKERLPWAKTRIELVDATTTLTSHIDSISKYYGYTMPVRDVTAILSYEWRDDSGVVTGSVNETLLKKWGKDVESYIDKLLADLQMPNSQGDILSDFLAKLRGNYASAVISFNPSSVLKQLASLPAAQPYLKSGALIHGMVSKADVSTLEKYSALYWYRNQGNTTTELGDVMKKKDFGDTIPLLFQTTQKMDSFVTRRLLAACEWRIKEDMGLAPGSKEEVEAGTDQYWREVAKLFNKVVLNTQSNSSMMERPQMTRANSGNIARFLTMFKTDAFQQFGMLTEAKGRLRAAKLKYKASPTAQNKTNLNKARAFAARTVTGILTGQVWSALVVYLMALLKQKDKKYRDKEGDFSWSNAWKELGKDVVGSLAGLMVGAETVYNLILAAVGEESWWGIGVDALEIVSDVAQETVNLTMKLKDGDWHNGRGAIKDLAFSLAKGFGVPMQNMETYIMSIVRWAAPEWSEQYENWFDETTKADLSEESKFTIKAAIGVVLDNRIESLNDEVKEELARLYMAGGKVAVPGAIPTSITYTNRMSLEVKVELSQEMREQYREKWAEVVLSGLPDLLSCEDYGSADDEGKAELVGKLYQYATQIAKNAVVPRKEVAKWVQQGLNAEKEGIPLAEYIAFRVDLSDITGKDETGETVTGLKAQRAMDLLEAMGWSDRQEENLYLDVLASDKKKDEENALREAGLSWDITNDVLVMTGSKWGKMSAIIHSKASEATKYKALAYYASDKQKQLLRVGEEFGVKLKHYAEVMNHADANGNGNVDSTEAADYIRFMDLGIQEKSYLWQMITDGKDGTNNPFSTYFGEMFYHAVHVYDKDE